jgi:hypothetical protein
MRAKSRGIAGYLRCQGTLSLLRQRLWDAANRGTMLRYLLALLAYLERAPGQAGPAAALPKISPLEPITTPFPRAQRCSLEPGSPAQRFAATQLDRRAQQYPAHHSGEDQSRFSLEGSSLNEGDPVLAQTPRAFRAALFRV